MLASATWCLWSGGPRQGHRRHRVRRGRWHLVRKYRKAWKLFEMDKDRTECTDVANAHPPTGRPNVHCVRDLGEPLRCDPQRPHPGFLQVTEPLAVQGCGSTRPCNTGVRLVLASAPPSPRRSCRLTGSHPVPFWIMRKIFPNEPAVTRDSNPCSPSV